MKRFINNLWQTPGYEQRVPTLSLREGRAGKEPERGVFISPAWWNGSRCEPGVAARHVPPHSPPLRGREGGMHNAHRFQTSNPGIVKVYGSSTKAGRFPFGLIFAFFLAVPLLGGCLFSKKTIKGETFAIATPPVANMFKTNGPVLAVQRVFVAPTFDTPSLTYRTGEVAFERDPYAGLLVSPGESFSGPIIVYLQDSGLFRAVVGTESSLSADLQLETHIERLEGDFRDRNHPMAVLEMKFVLLEIAGRHDKNITFQKSYLRRVPMKSRTAAAVVDGWNVGLQEIMKAFAGDLRMHVHNEGVAIGR